MKHQKGTFVPQHLNNLSSQLLNSGSKSQGIKIYPASQFLKLDRQSIIGKSSISFIQMYNFILLKQWKNLQSKKTMISINQSIK